MFGFDHQTGVILAGFGLCWLSGFFGAAFRFMIRLISGRGGDDPGV